jgi:hypothetical protein
MAVALAHRPLRGRSGPTLLWSVAGFGVFHDYFRRVAKFNAVSDFVDLAGRV